MCQCVGLASCELVMSCQARITQPNRSKRTNTGEFHRIECDFCVCRFAQIDLRYTTAHTNTQNAHPFDRRLERAERQRIRWHILLICHFNYGPTSYGHRLMQLYALHSFSLVLFRSRPSLCVGSLWCCWHFVTVCCKWCWFSCVWKSIFVGSLHNDVTFCAGIEEPQPRCQLGQSDYAQKKHNPHGQTHSMQQQFTNILGTFQNINKLTRLFAPKWSSVFLF